MGRFCLKRCDNFIYPTDFKHKLAFPTFSVKTFLKIESFPSATAEFVNTFPLIINTLIKQKL